MDLITLNLQWHQANLCLVLPTLALLQQSGNGAWKCATTTSIQQIQFLRQPAERVLLWCTMEGAIRRKWEGVVLRCKLQCGGPLRCRGPTDETLLERAWLHEVTAKFLQITKSLPTVGVTSGVDHLLFSCKSSSLQVPEQEEFFILMFAAATEITSNYLTVFQTSSQT